MKRLPIALVAVAAIIVMLRPWMLAKLTHPHDPTVATRLQLNLLGVALEGFKQNCGQYPTTEQGLMALDTKPPKLVCPSYKSTFSRNHKGNIVGAAFVDDWAVPLEYISDGKHYKIIASHGLTKESE